VQLIARCWMATVVQGLPAEVLDLGAQQGQLVVGVGQGDQVIEELIGGGDRGGVFQGFVHGAFSA